MESGSSENQQRGSRANRCTGRAGASKWLVAEMPLNAKNSNISGIIARFINMCPEQAFTNDPREN
jgi:hypothetical protein